MSLKMKYFVLKPRAKDAKDAYAVASQRAMMAYANSIEFSDPELANELKVWVELEGDRLRKMNWGVYEKESDL